MIQKKRTAWIATSNDKYRLIEYISDSAGDMARHFGVKTSTVFSSHSHHKKDGKDHRFMRIVIDEDEEEANG